tara:strand:+ start:51 stop:197 length:147 start_codon:yes stop_codon:yes gene_type:complete
LTIACDESSERPEKRKIVKRGLADSRKNVLQFVASLEGLERSTREALL